ncbi:hypothetical protein [Haloplanus halophilus]|nr:hypothetical protein [Haloplanus sp. GDY1]
MRYECRECGHFARFEFAERDVFATTCPACESYAEFEPAFQGEGVSF